MSARVRFILKSHPQTFFEVMQEEFVIGRLKKCEICLDDPHVSGEHARVGIRDGKYFIENLGRNPTIVNGKSIASSYLQNGDHIAVGLTEFLFQIVEEGLGPGLESPFELKTVALTSPTGETLGPRLILTSSSGASISYSIDKTHFVMGRSMDADVRIDDPSVSRKHGSIEKRAQGFFVRNFSNTNPLLVNDKAVSEQRLYTGDQLRVGSHALSFVSDRPEDVRPSEKKVVVKARGAPWVVWMVAIVLSLGVGGYLFYLHIYRPWETKQVLARVSEHIASSSSSTAQELLEDLFSSGPLPKRAREAREMIAQSTLATAQAMEKAGKLQEAEQLLMAYLKLYGMGGEAAAVWDRLDIVRLRTGQHLEASNENQEALRRYATVREDGPYAEEAQKAIRRVWLAYQQEGLKQQTMDQLLKQADEHFLAGRYLRPVNQNAYAVYQAVLALDPNNEVALQRIAEMKDFYRGEGEKFLESDELAKALYSFEQYSFIDPADQDVEAKIAICREGLVGTSAGVSDEEKKRIRLLLEESGEESSRIMKYLFEEPDAKKDSKTPW